jgi:hypothetical protein
MSKAKYREEPMNPFDLLTPNVGALTDEEKVAQKQSGIDRDRLIHQVFCQTEAGIKLKEEFDKVWINHPILRQGEMHDPYDIGIAQGHMDFIRNIHITCEAVAKGLKG